MTTLFKKCKTKMKCSEITQEGRRKAEKGAGDCVEVTTCGTAESPECQGGAAGRLSGERTADGVDEGGAVGGLLHGGMDGLEESQQVTDGGLVESLAKEGLFESSKSEGTA